MTIDSMGITQAPSASVSTSALKAEDMDRSAFLRLLTVQLKNQDPMDPMKNEDFVAQLAQFSSLEQLQNINQTLSAGQQANAGVQQAIDSNTAVALIGRKVEASDGISAAVTGEVTGVRYEGGAPILILGEGGELPLYGVTRVF